jgi:hypothetical protein
MTKVRQPATIEDALFRVLGLVGLEQCAALLNREPGYLRSLSDPTTRYRVTVEDALKLDVAYEAAGGQGAPIRDTYNLLYDAARAEPFADKAALGRVAIDALKEGSEAQLALVVAAQPGATQADRDHAAREVQQALTAFSGALPLLIDAPAALEPPP